MQLPRFFRFFAKFATRGCIESIDNFDLLDLGVLIGDSFVTSPPQSSQLSLFSVPFD